ncbi:hypothetical protein UA08_02006 [Talaromyces atroroseus]|uniref:Anaphase-promoting complex subunit 5 n=1 Tax=Talaromyces atroroseus TaxID=1441469 RepID=A0A1Q5QAZ4_TALAT|nr:hypothetical protein UA08_02006 [Talaromyces atroroseus]OKL63090.1 hypothetical protein UA08_02006 [Talaromyces atroroseus]
MSRYLTPSKVALLCLVSLYTEGIVPNTSAVPILSFLVAHILPVRPGDSDKSSRAFNRDRNHAVSMDELEEVLAYHASSIPGRSVWDLLLRKMWSLDCCDALESFFADIHCIVEKPREELIYERDNGIVPVMDRMLLSRSSPLGAFVRRAQLEFTRLQFHDSVRLWRGFIKYRLPTYRAWARRHPSGGQSAVDANLAELGLDSGSYLGQVIYRNIEYDSDEEAGISTKDVEQLLIFQVEELQRIGGRVPDEVRDQLEYIISTGVTVPSMSHYIRFLDAWKAGDYPSSFDNLHRYFDYTVHSRDRSFYQYALLNLAILHADFGSYAEAVSAMQEAISIARESHDMNCLNFCMSWLYHFGKAFPEEMKHVQNTGMLGSEKEGLAFLKAKAKETESWGLLMGKKGESLASVFENVVKSSYLNLTKDLRTTMGPQLLLEASLFSRIGLTHIASLHCDIFRECYAKGAPVEDHLKIAYRSSQLRWSQKSNGSYRRYTAGRFTVTQNIGIHDIDLILQLSFLEIEFRLRRGHYTQAMAIVEDIAQSIQQENFDVLTQIRLLCYKARILEKTGLPQRGFSMAMRAASIAHRSRVLPGLWEAIRVLAVVLLSLHEFEAASEMMESIMPQVLELDDRYLTARSYSILVDANMGLAGECSSTSGGDGRNHKTADPLKKKEYVTRALAYIDCSYDEYEAIEDVLGQSRCLAAKPPGFFKKSTEELSRLTRIAWNTEALSTPTKPYKLLDFEDESSVASCKTMADRAVGGFSTADLDYVPATATEPAHARFHGSISTKLPNNWRVERTGYAAFRNRDKGYWLFGRLFWDVDPYTYLALRVKSDGRRYTINIQSDSIVETDIHQHRLYTRHHRVHGRPSEASSPLAAAAEASEVNDINDKLYPGGIPPSLSDIPPAETIISATTSGSAGWETVLLPFQSFVRTNYGMIIEPQHSLLKNRVKSIGIGLTDRVEGPYDLRIHRIWATNGISEEEIEEERRICGENALTVDEGVRTLWGSKKEAFPSAEQEAEDKKKDTQKVAEKKVTGTKGLKGLKEEWE